MCYSDVTALPVSKAKTRDRPEADYENVHTCRNFWKIRDWAVERSGLNHPLPFDMD